VIEKMMKQCFVRYAQAHRTFLLMDFP
jgi:hypothetical protein